MVHLAPRRAASGARARVRLLLVRRSDAAAGGTAWHARGPRGLARSLSGQSAQQLNMVTHLSHSHVSAHHAAHQRYNALQE